MLGSLPGKVSAYKIASALHKDYESVSEYLNILRQAGLIHFIYTGKAGKAMLRNPTKMYPENTNLIHAAYLPILEDVVLGKVRETFAINQLNNMKKQVFYNEHGDFKVDNFIFEIGGKNKTNKQIKDETNAYVLADGILTGFKNKIPLYLLGFLY